ncbi:hypothetical protein K432DRAFT_424632 [Lepidopterella palustris CBS 459.81]|uniref:Zn(2)-C6 fungal-type domain-containing protein n=1 Tax=Lepidopterella palustris CBS 459.81 TaxID=1314670 RepID=A0A8E2JGK8_9PEZI|nr:hypothetical protein K432DRAFT_424632 [Lepidopterella palustris CBS 459.81]
MQHAQRPTSQFHSGRRQHRSCDQCRKGKRACDVAIVASSINWPSNRPLNARVGGGIDGQSPHAVTAAEPCSNCAKTGKGCTLEWLNSVRRGDMRRLKGNISGKTAPKRSEPSYTPHDRRQRRTSSASPVYQTRPPPSDEGVSISEPLNYDFSPTDLDAFQLATYFAADDKAADYSQADKGAWEPQEPDDQAVAQPLPDKSIHEPNYIETSNFDRTRVYSEAVNRHSGTDASQNGDQTFHSSKCRSDSLQSQKHPRLSRRTRSSLEAPYQWQEQGSTRRHPSFPWTLSTSSDPSSSAPQQRLAESANQSLLTGGLLQIYHDSMENALSCWLTEKTCPYRINDALSLPFNSPNSNRHEPMIEEWGPNWSNRICVRVCRLDRASAAVRDRPLTLSEEKAASRALHLAIMSFATQWAQNSQRSAAEFSAFTLFEDGHLDGSPTSGTDTRFGGSSANHNATPTPAIEFDREIQEVFWHQARRALQDTAEIESFRVIFAHIIFSLTQPPLDKTQHIQGAASKRRYSSTSVTNSTQLGDYSSPNDYGLNNGPSSCSTTTGYGVTMPSSKDLDEVIELEGPPIFLETALRQIYSYRCKLGRLRMRNASRIRIQASGGLVDPSTSPPSSTDPLTVEDRKTFDLLFWLSVMFDTLSAAMNKRPLVVSDEDSDVNRCDSFPNDPLRKYYPGFSGASSSSISDDSDSRLWGNLLLRQKDLRHCHFVARWPCSYEDAASTLCDAAPIKVLLFRKVTRLQTLLSRGITTDRLEESIHDALKVYQYWLDTYNPFILSCIANHDELPNRIQSWYVVLAGHWHLAGLLLADAIASVDDARMGLEPQRMARQSSLLVEKLREQNAYAISDLGRCASPRHDSSFAQGREFHHAVNKGALLTEPWTVVLIRSFSNAGNVLLELLANRAQFFAVGDITDIEIEQLRSRCESCIQALWYLGKKSDMALLAANALSDALRDRLFNVSQIISTETLDGLRNQGGEAVRRHLFSNPIVNEAFSFPFSDVPPSGMSLF